MVPYPSNFATIDPFTLFGDTVFADVHSHTVLLSSFPFSDVFPAVSPNESARTLAFVVQKITFVLLSISPGKHTSSVHFVFRPIA
jgi:hypothetical protein